MKKAIIVHCWDGAPNYCWYPETKRGLQDKGFEVIIPEMPETYSPKLSLWLPKLQEVAKDPDENLFLIGHSAGCITILKYLEGLEKNKKIGGVVLVAGFTKSLGVGYEELDNFFEKPLDFERVKTKSNFFVAINSDNDPHVPLGFADILKEKLKTKSITLHNMGHFSTNPINITSLPEVAQEILRMSS